MSCRKRSIAIGWHQQNWKMNFVACRQERKEEGATPSKSMNAALKRWRSSFSPWERRRRSTGSKFSAKNYSEDFRPQPLLRKCQEGREEIEEEQEQRKASQQMGPPAPGGCNEGLPAGLVFDPALFRGADGEIGGAGNFNAPYDRTRLLPPGWME